MGAVYEVSRVSDDHRLALKVLRGSQDRTSLARFAREAEVAATLDHPNLVRIFDLDVTNSGTFFLVMEYVPGTSLEGSARVGDVPWALSVIAQIATGLAAMHEKGIVHRDLKPANVLLVDDGESVKIADFGISRIGETGGSKPVTTDGDTQEEQGISPRALTKTGTVLGTPLYMAPELFRGARDADASADMYSLGVIAYQLLSGRLPIDPNDLTALILGVGIPARPALAELVPTLNERIARTLEACLSREPRERPDAGAVRAVLVRAVDPLASTVVGMQAPTF